MKNFSKIQPVKNKIQGVKKKYQLQSMKNPVPVKKSRKNWYENLIVHHRNFFHQGQERGFKLSPVLISNWLVRFGGKNLAREKDHTCEH